MGSLLGRKKKRSDPQNWRFLVWAGGVGLLVGRMGGLG